MKFLRSWWPLVIIAILVIVAIFAPALAPYDPSAQQGRPFSAPSAKHWLGLNHLGEDILSELIMGTRHSLAIATVASLITLTIAFVGGAIAGLRGGATDCAIMRVAEFFMAVPALPAILLLAAIMQGGFWSMVFVLTVMSWPYLLRLVRGEVVDIKRRGYIRTIRAMGASDLYIVRVHVLQELAPMLVYRYVLRFKSTILTESTLAFLGIGALTTTSWGTILHHAQARHAFTTGTWVYWALPAVMCIIVVSFSLMMLAYKIEERSDARLSHAIA